MNASDGSRNFETAIHLLLFRNTCKKNPRCPMLLHKIPGRRPLWHWGMPSTSGIVIIFLALALPRFPE